MATIGNSRRIYVDHGGFSNNLGKFDYLDLVRTLFRIVAHLDFPEFRYCVYFRKPDL